VDRASRRLARAIFHGMLRFGPGLEKKQAFLFRAVDVALELFVLTCSIMRAQRAPAGNRDTHALLARLAFATQKRVDDSLRDMWRNDDAAKYALAQELLQGRYAWLEQHAMPLPFDEAALTPPTMEQTLAARRYGAGAARAEPVLHAE
jgi:hypothetical protein